MLRNGESQRADGRYCYKYIDIDGKAKFVYSWKLTKTDRLPSGKRDCKSLRELQEEIKKELSAGVTASIHDSTLFEELKKFIDGKASIKPTTRKNYNSILNAIKNDSFVQKPVAKITAAEAKAWIKQLANNWGYGRISGTKNLISSMYIELIENEMLVRNPFNFKLSKIIANDAKERAALTPQAQKLLLDFVLNSNSYKQYYYHIKFLILTGLRIGEFCGLTVSDIDFEQKTLSVKHQLQRIKGERHITSLKTKTSKRDIPITSEIEECIRKMIDSIPKKSVTIDDYSGFITCTKSGIPCCDVDWYTRLKRITEALNKAKGTKFSVISPHILRHTFITNEINKGTPIKVVSYLAGHKDAAITLNVYTTTTYADVRKAILGE